jgi:hypothetical protein
MTNCLDKPPKFPFWVIREQGSREFWKRTVQVQNQGSEVILKDKAPTTTELVVRDELWFHLQILR